MTDEIAGARNELKAIKAELAYVQEEMMPYRMRRRAAKDALIAECVIQNTSTQIVTWWRAPTTSEIAALDEVNAWCAAALRDLEPRERALKEAARMAEIDLERAKRGPRKNRGKTAENDPPEISAVIRDPLKRLRTAERVPQSFSATAEGPRNDPKSHKGIARPDTGHKDMFE